MSEVLAILFECLNLPDLQTGRAGLVILFERMLGSVILQSILPWSIYADCGDLC